METGAAGLLDQELLLDRNLPDYKYQFNDVDHDTFVSAPAAAADSPVIISLDADAVREGRGPKTYRAIVRTARADTRLLVAAARKKDRLAAIRAAEPRLLPATLELRPVRTRDLSAELIDFDAKVSAPRCCCR